MQPKSGDLSNPNKCRGIALGDIAAKCVSSIIATRLSQHLVSFGMDRQNGSIFKKGCVDATFSLKLALQTLHKHNKEAYVLFVDLVQVLKAYDSVNRELV
jgi:Reverse transcriptase (RNA-dependent DNA polymerase)